MTVNDDLSKGFRLGSWTIVPEHGEISDGSETHRLEPKVMDVLLCLARHGGSLVTKQHLVDDVWKGRPVTDEVISRCISALRTHLRDDHRRPKYIETLPKRGYRLVAPVEPLEPAATPQTPAAANAETAAAVPPRRRLRAGYVLMAIAAAAVAYAAVRVLTPETPIGNFESVAVLPFTNLSAEQDQYLADGVTEELSYALTQLPDLKVAARTSAFQFRDTALDVRDIGRQIGVDGIIEGSVRRESDDLRVTAELVDARTGYQLWAVTFDGSVSEVFRLERRVAERVRDSIGAGGGRPRVAVTEPADPAAYDLYLRGRYALNRRGAASLEHAIGLFRESITLAPDYGPAYLELANAYLLLPTYTAEQADEMYESAVQTVDRGARADRSIAKAAAAVHGYIYNKRGNWLEADRAFQDALAARYVDSTTHQWYSNMLAAVGRLHDALEQARQAHRLDPLSPVVVSRLAVTELWTDNNAAAEAHFAVASELGISSPLHTESHLLLLLRQGRLDEVRQLAAAFGGGSVPGWMSLLLDCVAESVHCAEATAELESATDVSPRVRLVAWSVLGNTGKVREVARLLESDIGAFETELLFIAELAPFRRDPEFHRL
ncbi:MAG TPA: winged helix-turn-helix domain-containing protein, partial [Woeseiaceae bacterium]|nr:winged helix-turn-helix domain-containing protein [Woeseiaceae bacterium]